jgi:predicted dehydrogenase
MGSSSLSRRTFCLAAAASFASANDKKIRVAVLGTAHGHAASKIRALRTLPEFEFAGICRPDADEPNEGKVFEGVRWLALDEVLHDASIELVAVESRVGRNLAYAQQCVAAGKFVHLDKPPGQDLAGLRALFAEAHRRQRVVQLGYQWRYHPAMQAAIEAARNGWLGHVYAMRATIDKPLSVEERQALAKVPGGIMFEDGCHLIDRAVALFGKPKKVTSFLRHDSPIDDGMIDNALAVLEYDGAFAEIHMAAFQPHGNNYRCLEILGSNGKAVAQPFAPVRLLVDLKDAAGPYKAGAQTLEPPSPPGPTYAPDFREMAHILRDGAQPSYSPEHDLIAQQTLLEVCGVRA